MTENISIFIALLAGVLSFISPCILPLIPSYLSLIGGLSFKELNESRVSRLSIFLKTLLFVLGFSTVFMVLGLLFSSTGGLIGRTTQVINLVAGLLVIVLGFNFIFNFWKVLNVEKKFHMSGKPSGAVGSLLLGIAFGGGWTPCVGPILASILFLAGTNGRMLQGTILLGFYSLGLGLPFLLAGLFFSQFLKRTERIKPYLNRIRIAGGIFLVFIGLFILLGRLQRLNNFLFILAGILESWQQAHPWQPRLLFGLLFGLPFILLGSSYLKKVMVHKNYALSPVRIIFIFLFLILSVLTLGGVIDPTRFLTFWFTFQGI